MEYVTLGKSNLRVSRLCFGCEPLGGTDWGYVSKQVAISAIHKALDLGINFFDTAPVYGLGVSETRLCEALGTRRHDVVIASKCGLQWTPVRTGQRAHIIRDCRPAQIIASLENSLRRLRVDQISLYQIHWPDSATPLADTLEALIRCREAGKIRHIGVCNFPEELLEVARPFCEALTVQVPYSLIDRRVEAGVLPYCESYGLPVLAYGALGSGLLSGKYDEASEFDATDRRQRLLSQQPLLLGRALERVRRLRVVGIRRGRTPSQVALRWVLDAGGVDCVICGFKTPEQVAEGPGIFGWHLESAEREDLAA